MSGAVELLAQAEVGQDSVDLLARAELRQDTVDLFSNFRVSCPRRMGGNWQRKMWFDDTYYWRGRYDSVADELIFEYIAADGLAVNVWTKNANASIDCSGFAAGWILADFTVRGAEHGLRATIHYSDGVDTWIAESNEASLTGWAWQNTTKVFDGTAPDSYKKVNLGANRKTPIQRLWVSAVFVDASEGKQWVKARQQTNIGDITAWDAAVDVSNVDNTNTIYGSSQRSMGTTGAAKDDMMFVYKEGDALRSRYFTGAAWQAVQEIDVTTLPGKAAFDFEHGDVLGEDEGHVVYVDADGSVKWRERDAGAAEAWSAAETLHTAAVHQGVGIVEHGAGWLWVVWVEGEDILEYRLHQCVPELWYPLLANPALQFNVNTDAVVTTSTARQLNTHDHIPSGEAVPICWIGETAPATPCAAAWGILIEYSLADLMGIVDVRHLTSTDLYARLELRQDFAELLGKAEVGQNSAVLLGKGTIRQAGSAELLCKFEAQATTELLGKFEVGQGSAELLGKFEAQATTELLGKFEAQATAELLGRFEAQATAELLGRAVIRHVGTPVELLSKVVIRHTGIPRELVARCVLRHTASRDLDARVEICHWKDLYGKTKIRHTATPLDLPAILWARWPSRLWTSRRYVNGVIELDEKLLGDASLEYVIEGVMEDTQGYLDNAGLSYSEWTDITLVPVQILRAVTYGTVAAVYARHTQPFRSQVIPRITPVTVTVIGDAEKAMNYWEDRMNQMLEFYVTSQGGDVMLTSTLDEEPVFSMEDIPEEVTEYVSWRIWLQRRNG